MIIQTAVVVLSVIVSMLAGLLDQRSQDEFRCFGGSQYC